MPYTSEDDARAVMESRINDFTIVATREEDEEIIGYISLVRDKGCRLHSASFGLAVHEDWHGQGIGYALLSALIDTAEGWLGITRLTLKVFVDNLPAISLYKKCGFEIEGTLCRDAFRENRFVDAHLMARLSYSLNQ